MGTVTLLEFLNLSSGDGESELGFECLRAVPCVLLSHCLSAEGGVEVRGPSSDWCWCLRALYEDPPLPQGFVPQGFDGRAGCKLLLG